MQSKVLLTPVDSMVELIRETPNISILGISEKMRLPIQIVEVWILVLEEFEVVKVTYKGFEGYVALSKKELEQKKIVNKVDVENLKEIFIEKAKQKNYDYEKMRKLWPIFISEYEKDIKELFEDKAKERGFEINKIDMAWIRYKKELVIF